MIRKPDNNIEQKKSSAFMTLTYKVGEYFILVCAACGVIFYLFKNVYGAPFDIKQISTQTKDIMYNIDTIKGMQEFAIENIHNIDKNTNKIIEILNEQNEIIKNNHLNITKEIDNLKKAVYTKIPKPEEKNTVKTNNFNTDIDKSKLDSFFKARHNQNKEK